VPPVSWKVCLSLGGICPVPFTLPRIGNILGDMVAAYSAGARNIIQDIANLEQALSNICLGTGGIGANWNNMVDGSLKRLKQDIDTFGGSQIPENVIGQYVAQFNQSKTAISGIIDRMNEWFRGRCHKSCRCRWPGISVERPV